MEFTVPALSPSEDWQVFLAEVIRLLEHGVAVRITTAGCSSGLGEQLMGCTGTHASCKYAHCLTHVPSIAVCITLSDQSAVHCCVHTRGPGACLAG